MLISVRVTLFCTLVGLTYYVDTLSFTTKISLGNFCTDLLATLTNLSMSSFQAALN